MPPRRERYDVSQWAFVEHEPVGREEKAWLREPGQNLHGSERRWLFKPAVTPENGRRQDEDHVEVLVADLADLLGIPHAQVELARRNGVDGSISRNVAPDGWNLVLGSVLMTRHIADYQEGRRNVPGRPGHSVANVVGALGECASPPGVDTGAVGVFAAYLLLDAWVANQDRHDQNWAVLRRQDDGDTLVLAPSFDHASSLGFNVGDERRNRLVAQQEVDRWARRARAHRFEHDPSLSRSAIPTLVDVAGSALHLAGPTARRQWLGRLRQLARSDIAGVVQRSPELSDPSVTFILTLLDVNRRRILDEC